MSGWQLVAAVAGIVGTWAIGAVLTWRVVHAASAAGLERRRVPR